MSRAQDLIINAIKNSFDNFSFDDDFVPQFSIDIKSNIFMFTIEDESVTICCSDLDIDKTYKFKHFLQYLKGFTEHYEKKAQRLKPTRGLDMTAIDVNLTSNQELFLSEAAAPARKLKTDLIQPSDAISFSECQIRGILTTLTSKRVLSKAPSDCGTQYFITDLGYKLLGYKSPIIKPRRVIKAPVDGKPTKSIAEDFSFIKPERTGSSNKNPRAEYPKGEQPSEDDYDEAIADFKSQGLAKQPLCRELILLGFDNASVIKAIGKIMDVSYKDTDVNKQRRSLNRAGKL